LLKLSRILAGQPLRRGQPTERNGRSMMQTMRTLALLAICLSNASEAQTDAQADSSAMQSGEVIDEIVVTGANTCGFWPIPHRAVLGCAYVELKREDLDRVLEWRSELLSTCLNCQGNQCSAIAWPQDNSLERMVCKRIFWTPTRVSKLAYKVERSRPLSVSARYTISTAGTVKDIEIVMFDGNITEKNLLELLERGAGRTRFEPVVIDDTAYEITAIRASWNFLDYR